MARRHKLITVVAGVAALAAVLGAAPAAAAPAHSAHVATYAQAHGPLVNTNEDIKADDPSFCCNLIDFGGGNVPYTADSITSGDDFSEVSCVSAGGKDWCYLKDSHSDCMNVPTTGQYAFYVVASSCPSNDTAEEWARAANGSGWTYENRHTGQFMRVTCAVICYQVNVAASALVWALPQS